MTDRIDEIRGRANVEYGKQTWSAQEHYFGDVGCLLSIIDEQKARIEELERDKYAMASLVSLCILDEEWAKEQAQKIVDEDMT